VHNGVLIIERTVSTPRDGDAGGWPEILWPHCHRLTWDDFKLEAIRNLAGLRLLIVDAVDAPRAARALLEWLREHSLGIPVCAILPENDPELLHIAAEVVDEFLLDPMRPQELGRRVARLLGPSPGEGDEVAARLAAEVGMQQMVGRDPAFQKVIVQMGKFAANDAPVLLTGETGTGKELAARVMHLLSRRQAGPFIPVDCGALPDHLFENEIFGHARGAYTDARSDQKGLVALARKGTLFLDEIDSLSATAQSKVLRLLQEHTYRALGSEVFQQADVRILAATNRNLEELVERKLFRADLFFRINVLRVHLPALRDRSSDIGLLARHFVDEICANAGLPRKLMSPAAVVKLEQYAWPGNVRELYNILQRAVLCSSGTQIPAASLELRQSGPEPEGPIVESVEFADFRRAKLSAIRSFESGYVRLMMQKHDGNVTQAAREAGQDRRAFGRLAKKYGETERYKLEAGKSSAQSALHRGV